MIKFILLCVGAAFVVGFLYGLIANPESTYEGGRIRKGLSYASVGAVCTSGVLVPLLLLFFAAKVVLG